MRYLKEFLLCFYFFSYSLIQAQYAGDLVEIEQSPVYSGLGPVSFAFSPFVNGHLFAAAANNTGNSVSVYDVNPNSGELTPILGTPFPTGSGAYAVAFSPEVNGLLFAATANLYNDTLSVFSLDPTTGAFTLVDSPSTGSGPQSVAFSPLVNGLLFAAVANSGSNNVSIYSVNTTTGAFTSVGTTGAGTTPTSIAFSPLVNGMLFAAVANYINNSITVYSVDQTTGMFSFVDTASTGASSNPKSIAFSPVVNGLLFAAVANNGNGSVCVFSVNPATGAFTPVSNTPYLTGLNANSIAYSPLVNDLLFAAVGCFNSSEIWIYNVNRNTGEFRQLLNSPISSLPNTSIAYSPFVNGNLFAAVANPDNYCVSVYNVVLPPSVKEITPSQGPSSGGATVTILGQKFRGATKVLFGTTPATSFEVVSDSEITAVSPAGTGIVNISVVTLAGISAISSQSQFTYIPSPLPPTHAKGCKKYKKCKKDKNVVVTLTWDPPSDQNERSLITEYRIYKDKELTKLAGKVSSAESLKFKDCREISDTYTYYIVSVNIYGEFSTSVKVKVKKICRAKKLDSHSGNSSSQSA